MSGDIVNLRRARKERVRAEAEKTAAANRVTYGVPVRLRRLSKAEGRRSAATLEAHRIEPPTEA